MVNQKVSTEQVLFESNYARVFRTVYLYCESYSIAEDAVQEAFYKAFENLHKLRKRESFAAWVSTIAINHIRQEYKKQNKEQLISMEMVKEVACSRDDYKGFEQKEDVRRLLNSLDDKQKEVMLLHYMFGLKLNEISELQNVSTGTVKSRLRLAKAKLRKLYNRGVLEDGQ